jgi:transposase
MNRDVELERLRHENLVLRQTLAVKEEQMKLLKQENQSLQEALKETFQAIKQLREQVKALEEKQAKDSHNSHLPPSSDRFGKRNKSLRKPSGKKPGGQPGHQGHHLQPMAQVDSVVLHQVQECQHCHHELTNLPAEILERRQVIDLPPQCLWVTEHQSEEKRCPACGAATRAVFPDAVRATAQYGPRIQALGVYLVEGQMVPYARASQVLREVFGFQISASSVLGWVRMCSQAVASVETRIKEGLRTASVINQDETSVRVRRHRSYVHVCSTPFLTHYGYHPSRGRVALNAIGILAGFGGTSIHDGYNIYPGYPCQHALCNVHHLRELTFVEEVLKQPWAGKMKDLLLEMKEAVAVSRQAGKTEVDVVQLATFHFRYGALIREGFQFNPKAPPSPDGKRVKQSPAWNLLDRLHRFREATLRFLHDFAVAFDNNLAERDLRMIKVQQKVSGEFRTDQGADAFCRLRSYLSTLRKQGLPLFSALQQSLTGHPVLPTF